MGWVDQTYWIRRVSRKSPNQAIVLDEAEEGDLSSVLDLLQDELTVATVLSPCRDCEYAGECMDSIWADGKRLGGPSLEDAEMSSALRCLVCLSPFLDVGSEIQKEVSPECPRLSGNETICPSCRSISWELRKHNPIINQRCVAIGDALRRLARGEEIDGFQFLQSMMSPSPEDHPLSPSAKHILAHFFRDLPNRFPSIWKELSQKDLEGLHHLLEIQLITALKVYPDDPERVVYALLLEVLPHVAWGWVAQPLAARQFGLRVWEGVVTREIARSGLND